jgi:hypothetical protein
MKQEPVNADVLSAMLTLAGAYDHLAAAQWLRQRGAEWPTVLHFNGTDWSGDTLEWARAEGCDSPLINDEDITVVKVCCAYLYIFSMHKYTLQLLQSILPYFDDLHVKYILRTRCCTTAHTRVSARCIDTC